MEQLKKEIQKGNVELAKIGPNNQPVPMYLFQHLGIWMNLNQNNKELINKLTFSKN